MSRSKVLLPCATALAALMGLGLGGCAGGAVLTPANYASDVISAASGEAVAVEVRGNPFRVSNAEVTSDVASAMQGWNIQGPSSFFAANGPQSPDRVIVDFDGKGTGVCARPARAADAASATSPSSTVPGRIPVAVAFCVGDETLSFVSGSVSADGPNGEGFRRSMGEVTQALFPAYLGGHGTGHG
jgi:hypothetical protein